MNPNSALYDAVERVLNNPNKQFVVLFANRAQAVMLRDMLKVVNPATVFNLDDEYAPMTVNFFNEGKISVLLLPKDLLDHVGLKLPVSYTILKAYRAEDIQNQIVYVAIWEDHHADATAHVFSDKDEAIAWARKTAKEYDRYGKYEEELTLSMEKAGWVFNANYSGESDSIRVVRVKIDGEKP